VAGYNAAAVALKQEQAKKQRIANERALGHLLDVNDVQETVSEAAYWFVAGMEGLPGRVAEADAPPVRSRLCV